MRHLLISLLALFMPLAIAADNLDSLETILKDNPQIQEKIYVHLDNNCYFIGDTLWYKAYVVSADSFHPTDMSKLLYVELLTPDGYLVERQHVVVSDKGHTCGQFALPDSLYAGYYEVRAYTKWQLNFNVTERYYNFTDERQFFNKQMCADFYRDFEGLYSRVVPVYNKPKETGDYNARYMSYRPKQHVLKDKPKLVAHFFPEGGRYVKDVKTRVAFEVTDNKGQCLDIEGKLSDGTTVKTEFNGRGTFLFTPSDQTAKVTFHWNDKDYTFKLPKGETGCALNLDNEKLTVTLASHGTKPAAYAVLCRGRLQSFNRINGDGTYSLSDGITNNVSLAGADTKTLSTGVNEVIIYDSEANPLASRLFFVNNHDFGKNLDVTMTTGGDDITRTTTLNPYAKVELGVKCADNAPSTVSISVRDTRTDDPAYDDGNIMTDMLLSSELKGFVAAPAYYFEADDATHRHHLDLLMMVQGWRRYKRVDDIRYQPEKTTTYEGTVYKIPSTINILELDDVISMMSTRSIAQQAIDEMAAAIEAAQEATSGYSDNESENIGDGIVEETTGETVEYAESEFLGGKGIKRKVLVEAEVAKDGQNAGVIVETDHKGHFSFQIPPYYDDAILFIRAYAKKDSLKKSMASRKDQKWADEREIPDYYVKRDMFFPVFSQPYSWYQTNSPMINFVDEDDDEIIPESSKLAGNHQLQTVLVNGRKRGKRGINMAKPAMVRDAYDLYNDVTDYGLSFGVLDFRAFAPQAATFLVGNMGRGTQFHVRAMLEGASFFRNYTPSVQEYDKNKTATDMFNKLRLNRIKDVRIYTDYEVRTDSGDVMEQNSADVLLDFVPVANDAKRYTYRDRRYVFPGITYPEKFYSPDYSTAVPEEPKDYRRTLYWNPNARLDADGTFTATFYNNSRETRVKVSCSGMGADGQMYYK